MIGLKPTPRLIRAAEALLDRTGVPKPREITRLHGGSRNRIYRVRTPKRRLLLKQYFWVPEETEDRLAMDFQFCAFARSMGLVQIPAAVARDEREGLALFEYVDGRRLRRGEIGEAEVMGALEFVRELNFYRGHSEAKQLAVARDACFSVSSYIARVQRNVDELCQLIDSPENAADSVTANVTFDGVPKKIVSTWDSIEVAVRESCEALRLDVESSIGIGQRVLSPCDFGFHNALRDRSGRIRFLDFEFAGWDDPARLVGDFFSRPNLPVPKRYLDRFRDALLGDLPNPQFATARWQILEPLFQFDWACIDLRTLLANPLSRSFDPYPRDATMRGPQYLDRARSIVKALGTHSYQ